MKPSAGVFCEIQHSIELPFERGKSLFNSFITQGNIHVYEVYSWEEKQFIYLAFQLKKYLSHTSICERICWY